MELQPARRLIRQETLKRHAQARLLHQIAAAVHRNRASSEAGVVLIVDEISLGVLDSVCSLTELHAHRFSLLESLENERKHYTGLDGVYLLEPSFASVRSLLNDFKDPARPTYGAVHLFFLRKLPPALFELLGSSLPLVRRVRNLREVNLHFRLEGPNAFSLPSPHCPLSPFSVYATAQHHEHYDNPLVPQTVEQLFTLCTTLNEFPFIQHCRERKTSSTSTSTSISGQIASLLHKKLRGFYSENKTTPFNSTNRASLLILDRNFDLAAPVAHGLDFGQMLYDFLLKDKAITYKVKDQEGVFRVDDERDQLWQRYRGKHIVEVIQQLPREAQEFMVSVKQSASGLSEIEQLKRQPKQNDLAAKYRACQAMGTQVVLLYKERNIARLVEVEQLILAGVDDFNKQAANRVLIQEISKLKKEVAEEDFLRLLWIYLSTYELNEKEAADFVNNNAGSPASRQLLRNLRAMGRGAKKTGRIERRAPLISGEEFKLFKERQDAVSYQILKKGPRLVEIVGRMREKALSTQEFPFVEAPPDYGRAKGRAKKKKLRRLSDDDEDQEQFVGEPRCIVYVVGALSYTELLAVQERFKEVAGLVLGSNALVNAAQFLNLAGELHKREEDYQAQEEPEEEDDEEEELVQL